MFSVDFLHRVFCIRLIHMEMFERKNHWKTIEIPIITIQNKSPLVNSCGINRCRLVLFWNVRDLFFFSRFDFSFDFFVVCCIRWRAKTKTEQREREKNEAPMVWMKEFLFVVAIYTISQRGFLRFRSEKDEFSSDIKRVKERVNKKNQKLKTTKSRIKNPNIPFAIYDNRWPEKLMMMVMNIYFYVYI